MTDPLIKGCDLYPRTSRGPGERGNTTLGTWAA